MVSLVKPPNKQQAQRDKPEPINRCLAMSRATNVPLLAPRSGRLERCQSATPAALGLLAPASEWWATTSDSEADSGASSGSSASGSPSVGARARLARRPRGRRLASCVDATRASFAHHLAEHSAAGCGGHHDRDDGGGWRRAAAAMASSAITGKGRLHAALMSNDSGIGIELDEAEIDAIESRERRASQCKANAEQQPQKQQDPNANLAKSASSARLSLSSTSSRSTSCASSPSSSSPYSSPAPTPTPSPRTSSPAKSEPTTSAASRQTSSSRSAVRAQAPPRMPSDTRSPPSLPAWSPPAASPLPSAQQQPNRRDHGDSATTTASREDTRHSRRDERRSTAIAQADTQSELAPATQTTHTTLTDCCGAQDHQHEHELAEHNNNTVAREYSTDEQAKVVETPVSATTRTAEASGEPLGRPSVDPLPASDRLPALPGPLVAPPLPVAEHAAPERAEPSGDAQMLAATGQQLAGVGFFQQQQQQSVDSKFCYSQFESPPSSCAQLYPNNTLLADLIELHPNIASLWPRLASSSPSSSKSCKDKKAKQQQDEDDCKDEQQVGIHKQSQDTKISITSTTTTSNHSNHFSHSSGRPTSDNFNYNHNNNHSSTPILLNYTATNKDYHPYHHESNPHHNHSHHHDHHHHHQQQQQAHSQNKSHKQKKKRKSKRPKLKYNLPQTLRDNQSIKLSPEDYDKAICVLTADSRFKLHLLLYQRIPLLWLLATSLICVAVPPVLLLSLEWVALVGTSCLWLSLQLCGFIVTIQLRRRLDHMLEKSVAQVNSYLVDHHLLLGVINSSSLLNLSSKLMIPIVYYDTTQCRTHIESMIKSKPHNNSKTKASNPNDVKIDLSCVSSCAQSTKLHLSSSPSRDHNNNHNIIDDIINKPQVLAMAQSQQAKRIILRFSQRWISRFERRKLVFGDDCVKPRHLSTGKCLCQYFEEEFASQSERLGLAAITFDGVDNNNNHKQPQEKVPVTCNKKPAEVPAVATNPSGELPTVCGQLEQQNRRVRTLPLGAPSAVREDLKCTTSGGRHLPSEVTLSQAGPKHQDINSDNNSQLNTNLLVGATIGPSDDLIQKLRSLLASRKDDLQLLDGCLFSDIIYRIEQSPLCVVDDEPSHHYQHHQDSSAKAKTASASLPSDYKNKMAAC